MSVLQSDLIKKGAFALAAVAIVGSTTAVYAAVNTSDNTTSGYGTTSQEATAAAVMFANSINDSNNDFASDVDALSATAKARLASGSTVDDFNTKFDAATSAYDASLNSAFDMFLTSVQNSANTAESKDMFIDQFNNAKAAYLNRLDVAKNDFAAAVSPLGDNANQAKDAFIGGYNTSRDAYSNDLEAAKNKFADTISNL